jgi:hypothetical protein
MSSAQQRKEYLEEHLYYELLMLRFSYREINKSQSPLIWNAFFDSFVMHARNLIDFLTNDGGVQNFKAVDFTVDYIAPDKKKGGIQGLYDKLHAHALHLGKLRPTDDEKKINVVRAQKLFDWIEKHLPNFGSKLTPQNRQYWKPDLAVPPKDMIGISLGPTLPRGPTTTTVPQVAAAFVSVRDNKD